MDNTVIVIAVPFIVDNWQTQRFDKHPADARLPACGILLDLVRRHGLLLMLLWLLVLLVFGWFC